MNLLQWLRQLWEWFLAWITGDTDSDPSNSTGAVTKQRPKKKQHKPKSAGTAAAVAAAPPATSKPPEAASASEDEDSEQDDDGEGGLMTLGLARRGVVGTASAVGAADGAWERVGEKKPPLRLGGTAAGPRPRGSTAAARRAAALQPKGERHTCERPECGAEGHGYKKCGRCRWGRALEGQGAAGEAAGSSAANWVASNCAARGAFLVGSAIAAALRCALSGHGRRSTTILPLARPRARRREVYYCTPACLASDWERHQVQCK
jgi:hypothetical protein